MKIGTVNFHKAQNYGALLQAYALRKWIINQGAEACCVDYFPNYHANLYPHTHRKTADFINECLPAKSIDEKYDLVIYGSDTIWKNHHGYGFDEVYWGDHTIRGERKITFSASAVMGDFNAVSAKLFVNNLHNFNALAVREDCLQEYIQRFTETNVYHTCDPTFLLSCSEWANEAADNFIDGEYGFIYNQQYGPAIYDIAETFSSKIEMPVYIISECGLLREQCGRIIRKDIGPREFLSLFINSQYVLTPSFHGVAFALIFKKPFWTMMKSASQRVESILRKTNLESRLIKHSSELDISSYICYTSVHENLDKHISLSKGYLLASIERGFA